MRLALFLFLCSCSTTNMLEVVIYDGQTKSLVIENFTVGAMASSLERGPGK